MIKNNILLLGNNEPTLEERLDDIRGKMAACRLSPGYIHKIGHEDDFLTMPDGFYGLSTEEVKKQMNETLL